MLLCKSCNTRFAPGRSVCPSCGRRSFTKVADSKGNPGDSGSLARANPKASEGASDTETDTEIDLELQEVDVLAAAVEPSAAEELKRETPVKPARRLPREPGPAVLQLAPAQVRTLVAEQPALLEPKLGIYEDENGNRVGVEFPTPVGAIDLLARAADGGFVIVMVPDSGAAGTLVPEILARIGYVRKHVAASGKSVRGVVVIDQIPEELAYAAAGVSETVSFKTYRVALTFHDLAL